MTQNCRCTCAACSLRSIPAYRGARSRRSGRSARRRSRARMAKRRQGCRAPGGPRCRSSAHTLPTRHPWSSTRSRRGVYVRAGESAWCSPGTPPRALSAPHRGRPPPPSRGVDRGAFTSGSGEAARRRTSDGRGLHGRSHPGARGQGQPRRERAPAAGSSPWTSRSVGTPTGRPALASSRATQHRPPPRVAGGRQGEQVSAQVAPGAARRRRAAWSPGGDATADTRAPRCPTTPSSLRHGRAHRRSDDVQRCVVTGPRPRVGPGASGSPQRAAVRVRERAVARHR